jgi:hypothetical protein
MLPDMKEKYWPRIVKEDFILDFFIDLLHEISGIPDKNVLSAYRNPTVNPPRRFIAIRVPRLWPC